MNNQPENSNLIDRKPWGLQWALLFQLLVMVVFLVPPAIVRNAYFAHFGLDAQKSLVRIGTVELLGMLVFTVYVIKRFKDLSWKGSLRFLGFKKPKFRPILIGLLSLIPTFLYSFYQFWTYQDMFYSAIPLETVLAVTMAASFEEIYFRGFLFQLLRRGRGFMGAAAFSGLFWATAHLIIFSTRSEFDAVDIALTMATAFIFSFSLALLFEKSGNALWGCVVAHVGYDLLLSVFVPNPDYSSVGSLTEGRLSVFIMLISTVLITWGLTAWLLPQSPEMPASPGAEIKLPNRENAVSDQWSFSLMAAFLVTALLVAPSVMSQNQPEKSGSVDAPSPEALAHLKSGTALATDNQYDPAIREFQKVVELDPENAQAYTFWGNCLNDEGKYGEAIPLFRKASEIVPQEAVIYVYWGASLKGLGRTDEALLMFQRAIQTEPLNGVITQTANDEIAKMKETKGPGL